MKFEEGTRVRVKSLNQKGKIDYIDAQRLFLEHFHPIQVELDQPYDESQQRLYRTDLKDLKKLVKRKRKAVTK